MVCVIGLIIHVSAVFTFGYLGYDIIWVIGIGTSAKYTLEFGVLYFLCWSNVPTSAKNTIFLSPTDGAFKRWLMYLKISMPAGILLFSTQMMYEVMVVVAGWMGELNLQTMTVIIAFLSIAFEFGFGFSFAVASVVGQYVGLNDPTTAKRIA